MKKIKEIRVQETTVVHKIWGGYLRSQVKCQHCGFESNTYEAMLDLSLEIRGNTIESALKHFTSPERLSTNNQYRCSNCKKLRDAIKQFTIFEPPNILVIQLKRFKYQNLHQFHFLNHYIGGKIDKHVTFKETLDITEFMSDQTQSRITYSLFGAIIHYGSSAQSGHYVSYVKAPNEQWFLMDDANVTRVSLSSVLSASPYVLFYARNEPKIIHKSPNISPLSFEKKNVAPILPLPNPKIEIDFNHKNEKEKIELDDDVKQFLCETTSSAIGMNVKSWDTNNVDHKQRDKNALQHKESSDWIPKKDEWNTMIDMERTQFNKTKHNKDKWKTCQTLKIVNQNGIVRYSNLFQLKQNHGNGGHQKIFNKYKNKRNFSKFAKRKAKLFGKK